MVRKILSKGPQEEAEFEAAMQAAIGEIDPMESRKFGAPVKRRAPEVAASPRAPPAFFKQPSKPPRRRPGSTVPVARPMQSPLRREWRDKLESVRENLKLPFSTGDKKRRMREEARKD